MKKENGTFSVNVGGSEAYKTQPGTHIQISVIVPVMDEKENLEELYRKIKKTLGQMKCSHEIIFIDDGSTDGSLELLNTIVWKDGHVRVISFRKNYGQTAAIAAGFKYAHGGIVIAMDADLQNDPADIPLLVARINDGADVVSGWRKNRKDDTFKRKVPSIVANIIINKLIAGTGVHLHDYGCTLKAYRKEVVQNLKLYGEMHRFIPAFAAWLGVRVDEVVVRHHPRKRGSSKYGLSRIPRVIFDFIIVRFFADYLTKPIQFFGKIALFFSSAGVFLSLLLLLAMFFFGWGINFNTFLLIGLFSVILSVQCISVGLLGEIHVRNYFELQDKDPYVIREIIEQPENSEVDMIVRSI